MTWYGGDIAWRRPTFRQTYDVASINENGVNERKAKRMKRQRLVSQ